MNQSEYYLEAIKKGLQTPFVKRGSIRLYGFEKKWSIILSMQLEEPFSFQDRIFRFLLPMRHALRGKYTPSYVGKCVCEYEFIEASSTLIVSFFFKQGMDGEWLQVSCEMISLALRMCQEEEHVSRSRYALSDFLRMYERPSEVLAVFRELAWQVIDHDEDLYWPTCDETLFVYGLCCFRHRFLLTMRDHLRLLLFNLYVIERDSEPEDDKVYSQGNWKFLEQENAPKRQWQIACLQESLFRSYENDPQHFLKDQYDFSNCIQQKQYMRPVRDICSWRRRMHSVCCPLHQMITVVGIIHALWTKYFEELYEIDLFVDKEGHSTSLFSLPGLSLFLRESQVDPSTIPFDSWSSQALTLDVSEYQKKSS